MTQALELADLIGRKKMAEALGVGVTAVSNAVVRGRFPASWFVVLAELAGKEGHECPPSLFGMKTIAADADGTSEDAA